MREGEKEVLQAAKAAILDWSENRGGYYNGPATGIYLQIVAALQTAQARGLVKVRNVSNSTT